MTDAISGWLEPYQTGDRQKFIREIAKKKSTNIGYLCSICLFVVVVEE